MLTLNTMLLRTLLKRSNGKLRRRPQKSFLSIHARWSNIKNKDKHQAFSMQFSDKQFEHDTAIALSFRKPISHEANKVSQLAEEICDEMFGLKFQDMFASSVQDLAASDVAKELEVDKVECGTRQDDKDGDSSVGKLVRTVNQVNFIFSILGVF